MTLTRSEVMNYLQAQGQSSRQDSSNLDLHFIRNRIRHELLPFLENKYNPAVVETLCRLAKQAEEAFHCFETRAEKLLAQVELPCAGPLLIFDRQRLLHQRRALVREMFRLVWAREDWPQAQMGHKEWDRLAAVAFGELVAVDLPDGIRAVRRDRVIQVGPGIRDQ
jgi:tRNA(Ile)-lysidine synthase TilS/MesJ